MKVIAFITPEYTAEIAKLKASCTKFGYELIVKEYDSRGTWQKNTYIKPEFIASMMYEYPDEALLYLDADAVIEQKLTFFDDFKGDVSFHKSKGNPMSGTMYFAPTQGALAFCEMWMTLRAIHPNLQGDQDLIQFIDVPYTYTELPSAYVKIFDSWSTEEAVIKHNQASRRLKQEISMENKTKQMNNYQYSTNKEDRKYSEIARGDEPLPSLAESVGSWALARLTKTLPKILDIGCGEGLLRAVVPFQVYLGIDIASGLIKKLIETVSDNDKEDFLHGDASQLDDIEPVDIVYCLNTLQHLPEDMVLESLKQICLKGATQIISVNTTRTKQRGSDGAELNLTVKPISWWADVIGTFTTIQEKTIMGENAVFFCGENHKSPKTTIEIPFPIRRYENGILWLVRKNRKQEKWLDENFQRIPNELRWAPRIEDAYNIKQLEGDAKDQTVYIVGKGPSLDNLQASDFVDGGPILALNEAYTKVKELDLPNKVYLLQQDEGIRIETNGPVILNDRIQYKYPDVEERYLFTSYDLQLGSNALSVVAAIKLAKHMGAKEVVLVSFDASVNSAIGYAECVGHEPRRTTGGGPERFLSHKTLILQALGLMPVVWITPKSLTCE